MRSDGNLSRPEVYRSEPDDRRVLKTISQLKVSPVNGCDTSPSIISFKIDMVMARLIKSLAEKNGSNYGDGSFSIFVNFPYTTILPFSGVFS
jgi:hypothetical protein